MANPYLVRRGTSHFRDMPNPYALPGNPLHVVPPVIPAMLTATRPSQPSWRLQPRYEPQLEFVSALEVLEGRYPDCTPQNLAQEHNFELSVTLCMCL
jgi:hypothetical protein